MPKGLAVGFSGEQNKMLKSAGGTAPTADISLRVAKCGHEYHSHSF